MPLYIISFQSSPVKIYLKTSLKTQKKDLHLIYLKDGNQCRREFIKILQGCFFFETESIRGKSMRGKYIAGENETYSPPNNCMPNRAKIRMNKKRRNSKLTIDRILLNKETTKLRSDAQCLESVEFISYRRKEFSWGGGDEWSRI